MSGKHYADEFKIEALSKTSSMCPSKGLHPRNLCPCYGMIRVKIGTKRWYKS